MSPRSRGHFSLKGSRFASRAPTTGECIMSKRRHILAVGQAHRSSKPPWCLVCIGRVLARHHPRGLTVAPNDAEHPVTDRPRSSVVGQVNHHGGQCAGFGATCPGFGSAQPRCRPARRLRVQVELYSPPPHPHDEQVRGVRSLRAREVAVETTASGHGNAGRTSDVHRTEAGVLKHEVIDGGRRGSGINPGRSCAGR
jgi:hypothetical protein